jgi:hypothetical protein
MNESEPQDTSQRDQNRSRVRASDAERERIADKLRAAVTDGRLSLEEGDERLAVLYATKFRDELPSLTRDLPGGAGDEQQDASGRSGGWGWGPRGPRPGRPDGTPDDEGWSGPGWGGPGWRTGPGGGAPGWGGPGGPGWGGWSMRRPPWPFRVFPVIMLLIVIGVIVSAVGGHFFWPIIPLFFLTMAFTRFAIFRACRRGWTR